MGCRSEALKTGRRPQLVVLRSDSPSHATKDPTIKTRGIQLGMQTFQLEGNLKEMEPDAHTNTQPRQLGAIATAALDVIPILLLLLPILLGRKSRQFRNGHVHALTGAKITPPHLAAFPHSPFQVMYSTLGKRFITISR